MNEKNKHKRKSVTLDRKWHHRFKVMAAKEKNKIENLIDEAACYFLRNVPEIRK